ncbi:MAG TPA: hypothetical protein VFT75_18490 [Nocardioidaceae bacterium]|nr:hypothetical protein [Nocardioidaceae bacterium]
MKISTMTDKIGYYADMLQFGELDAHQREHYQRKLDEWTQRREQQRDHNRRVRKRVAPDRRGQRLDSIRRKIAAKEKTLAYYAKMRHTNPEYFDAVAQAAELALRTLQRAECDLIDPRHKDGQCKRRCWEQ